LAPYPWRDRIAPAFNPIRPGTTPILPGPNDNDGCSSSSPGSRQRPGALPPLRQMLKRAKDLHQRHRKPSIKPLST